jgi:hypothetical protein
MSKLTGIITITTVGDRPADTMAKAIADCLAVQCQGILTVEVDLNEAGDKCMLTADELHQKRDVHKRLQETHKHLRDVVAEVNAEYRRLWMRVDVAVTEYNDAIDAANRWMSDVHDRLEKVAASKPRRWMDSPEGNAFEDWMEDYRNELCGADLGDAPAEIEMSDVEYSEFEQLTDGPGMSEAENDDPPF